MSCSSIVIGRSLYAFFLRDGYKKTHFSRSSAIHFQSDLNLSTRSLFRSFPAQSLPNLLNSSKIHFRQRNGLPEKLRLYFGHGVRACNFDHGSPNPSPSPSSSRHHLCSRHNLYVEPSIIASFPIHS